MSILRAAVIGGGYFGERHAGKWAAMDGVELVAIADVVPERARSVAERFGTHAVTDYRELIGRIDLASVVVPTAAHFEVTQALLQAGVHVLVEKPLAYSLEHADRMLEDAAARGLVLRVGHLERFNPAFAAAREQVRAPLFIECHRLTPFRGRGTDVDVVLDIMIHDLDLILDLVDDEVSDLRASGVPVLTDDIDIANARIEFARGCVANVSASRVSVKSMRKLRVFQADCYVSMDLDARAMALARRVRRDGQSAIEHANSSYPEADALAAQVADFVRAVRGEPCQLATGADGRRALALALAIKQNMRSRAGA